MWQNILLLTDNSKNTKVAVDLALKLCHLNQVQLQVLFFTSTRPKNLLGDEWMTDPGVLNHFFRYMDETIKTENNAVVQEIQRQASQVGVPIQLSIKSGRPYTTLLEWQQKQPPFDLIVLSRSFASDKSLLKLPCGILM